MDEKELLRFIQRIVRNSDPVSASERLVQLRYILAPTADASLLNLIDIAIKDYPEVREDANYRRLTPEGMQIAHERGENRRRQEEMMRHYGRC